MTETDPATGLPIGAKVEKPVASRPTRSALDGRFVSLVLLTGAHADDLWKAIPAEHAAALYRYMPYGPFGDLNAFRADVEQKSKSEDPLFFAIVDKRTGRCVGHATFMRIDPQHRVIEVGSILYSPILQRTAGATEAMYLMARHVFEDLGYRRYEWKCDSLNAPSRAAALRLGFTFEGIFRQHMVIKGRNRDTAWFSMIDTEWPARKAMFEAWLVPSNFDAEGGQRKSLSAFA